MGIFLTFFDAIFLAIFTLVFFKTLRYSYKKAGTLRLKFGAAWRLQKQSDLAEILHTCSLGEYLGVLFSFFENFDSWGLGTSFSAKTRLKLWGSL